MTPTNNPLPTQAPEQQFNPLPELTPEQLRALRPGDLVTLTCYGWHLCHCSISGQRAEVVKVGRGLVHVRSQTSGLFRVRIDAPTPRPWGITAVPYPDAGADKAD